LGDPQLGDVPDCRTDRDRTAPTTHSFPTQLRRLRQERGLSLTDLARQTHYSKGYLSKIETGAKRATVDVARLCDQVLRAEGELLRLVQQAPPRDAGVGYGPDTGEQRSGEACPYRGLAAFTPQDAEWFFGREHATAALVERIFEQVGRGPLMLVAPSGAGKSSLLNAGLVPALRRGDLLPDTGAIRVVQRGRRPGLSGPADADAAPDSLADSHARLSMQILDRCFVDVVIFAGWQDFALVGAGKHHRAGQVPGDHGRHDEQPAPEACRAGVVR
jgi:transcriptional regulator with XRE-family HTH domain